MIIFLQRTGLFLPALLLFSLSRAEAAEDAASTRSVAKMLDPLVTFFSANPWVQGAAVILITFTIASFVTWILFKLLRRLFSSARFNIDEHVILMLRPPIYYTLLAAGIYAGIELMPLSERLDLLVGRIIRTIGALVWVVFFMRLATMTLQRLADLSYTHTFIQHRTLSLFDNAAKILIFGVGIYAFFVIWKIDMTAWLASAGIVGIAVGFAAKDTLSNLFSGVFILADAPYKIGDYVVLDRGDRGKVMNIGLRSTRILTRDDIEITIPNSIIGNSTIVNQSGGHHTKMRLRVKIGVAYGSDIDAVRSILMEIAHNEDKVCPVPEPRVRFRTFGASSLDFELLAWIDNPELRGLVMDKLNDAIYKAFAAKGVEIPYAKQDVYIRELPPGLRHSENEASEEEDSGGVRGLVG
ncbi:MAG TPA: mechanosensitive ion channel family protein [Desulfopila sp.]|nr:mechanosensitive ion channel family protein [Desulfopila sp.]